MAMYYRCSFNSCYLIIVPVLEWKVQEAEAYLCLFSRTLLTEFRRQGLVPDSVIDGDATRLRNHNFSLNLNQVEKAIKKRNLF
ncbi:UNVERIFIED_CONTAM: hypothetical protein PYX00_009099 [Menopon gallinae]|uniref:Uncharacterized protein n=1 Tax=Menopon gallinae TaxID=328185 RepID=A0AAW2HA08_9NEOP